MSLMAYLCRLITPPNGTVLDPFMGSGSTGKAAVIEGFNFVGVELDPEYFKIAEARINYALSGKVQSVEDVEDESPEELPEDEKEPTDKPDSLPTQLDMFD
jgi:DNA modification methylase